MKLDEGTRQKEGRTNKAENGLHDLGKALAPFR